MQNQEQNKNNLIKKARRCKLAGTGYMKQSRPDQ